MPGPAVKVSVINKPENMRTVKISAQLLFALSLVYFVIRLIGANTTGISPELIQKGLVPAILMGLAGSLLLLYYYKKAGNQSGTRYALSLLFVAITLGAMAAFTRIL